MSKKYRFIFKYINIESESQNKTILLCFLHIYTQNKKRAIKKSWRANFKLDPFKSQAILSS